MSAKLLHYADLLSAVKIRIRQAQTKAVLSANAEMIIMYWDIGRIIDERQHTEGWGSAVIPRLAKDIRNELPEVKGFSERNIGRMIAFYREYSGQNSILPQVVAKLDISLLDSAISEKKPKNLPQIVAKLKDDIVPIILQNLIAKIPWGHNILLMEKVKDMQTRFWYMWKALENGWSRNVMDLMIKSKSHERQGNSVTNFHLRLPAPQSDMAVQMLKDPYVFDFLTLEEPFHERELETKLIQHLEKFLIELGAGFAFVGRQYHIEVSDKDFYIDLLFYHLKLRCFLVIDLKKGDFKPEYAGKINFYCSVVDDKMKHKTDNPTIELILCQTKDRILAEYALRDIHKPIGVSDYELTRALPERLKSSLPTVEEIEKELGKETAPKKDSKGDK